MAGSSGDTTVAFKFDLPRDEPAPCLVMIRGTSLGWRIALPEGETVLGRGPQCGVVVAMEGVSRTHCAFEVASDRVTVRDLGSMNGTWVGGQRLEPGAPALLHNGAVLHTGDASFKYISHGDTEADYHEAVYRMLTEDALTQAKNRRFLMDVLDREVAREQRHEKGLALLLLDIDAFKHINDAGGHVYGDFVLREIASLIARQARRTDCLARYGGDEFAVVLTETTRAGAEIFAERLRGHTELTRFTLDDKSFAVTVSIGVAFWQPEIGTPEALLKAADVALYAAKSAGRNRVAS
jgi:diguanylate cyclase (GGDEF)-like protein